MASRLLPLVAAIVVVAASAAAAPVRALERGGGDPRRGPFDLRDGFVLAQPRLTLGPCSPDTLGDGRATLELSLASATTFAGAIGRQEAPPTERAPLADAEAHTLALTWTLGVREDFDVGLRFVVSERGGGFFDPAIDSFHQTTGLGETRFDHGLYEVSGPADDGTIFDWDEQGIGLGDLEVQAKWRLTNGGRNGLALALLARATVPTGTEPFAAGGTALGLEVVVAQRLWRAFDVYAGVGGTACTLDEIDGVVYERVRGTAFVALEVRPGAGWSLLGHLQYSSPLVANIQSFSESGLVWSLGARFDLSSRVEAHVSLVENEVYFGSTADVALQAGLTIRN